MSLCPGVTLSRPLLRSMPAEEQLKVYKGFRAVLRLALLDLYLEIGMLIFMNVSELEGIEHQDKRAENLIYDATSGRV